MTSLFRRSSSNGGSRSGGGGGGSGQLNNSRPNRQVRRLEFNQAMEDFKTMFPSMDYEVIECVLRSNNGAVDATIDQLLQMSIDGQGSDDSSDSDDSIPPEVSLTHAPPSAGLLQSQPHIRPLTLVSNVVNPLSRLSSVAHRSGLVNEGGVKFQAPPTAPIESSGGGEGIVTLVL